MSQRFDPRVHQEGLTRGVAKINKLRLTRTLRLFVSPAPLRPGPLSPSSSVQLRPGSPGSVQLRPIRPGPSRSVQSVQVRPGTGVHGGLYRSVQVRRVQVRPSQSKSVQVCPGVQVPVRQVSRSIQVCPGLSGVRQVSVQDCWGPRAGIKVNMLSETHRNITCCVLAWYVFHIDVCMLQSSLAARPMHTTRKTHAGVHCSTLLTIANLSMARRPCLTKLTSTR